MKTYKSIRLFLALVVTGLLTASCQSAQGQGAAPAATTPATTPAAAAPAAPAAQSVTTIRVGTGHAYKPYCYLDDDGNLAGYEFEVLKAVDALLPQYEFTYELYDFKNILLSIDSGKVDIGAHQFEVNPERVANYLFGDIPYTTFIRYIVVDKDRTDISGIDDLGGKKVLASPGDNANYFFDEWNKAHPDNPMIVEVVEGITTEERATGIKNKKWDAYSATKRDVADLNAQYGDTIKTVGDAHINSSTFFVYKKGNTELQQAVDGALTKLKENGLLRDLSITIIGGDFTESE